MTYTWEKTRWSRARRPHACCECHSEITPGTEYASIAGCWDGDFYSEKMCGACHHLRGLYFHAMEVNWSHEPDEISYSRGSLIEEIECYLERSGTESTLAGAVLNLGPLLVADAQASLREARGDALRARDGRARRVYAGEQAYYSRLMIRGMSRSSCPAGGSPAS